MYKQVQAVITQAGSPTETQLTIGTTGNIIIISAMVQSTSTGNTEFYNDNDLMFAVTNSNDVTYAPISSSFPVHSLNNTLKILTKTYSPGDIINVVVNYMEGAANNPMFVNNLFDYESKTYSATGSQLLLINSDVQNYNLKSLHFQTSNTAQVISLYLYSTIFPSSIPITGTFTGEVTYQLLSNEFILKVGDRIEINTSTSDAASAYLSYTKVNT